jgi:tetratricopeptide (TPR) repeat protein
MERMLGSPLLKSLTLPQAIQQAARLHRQGQLGEAERLYGGILEAKPDHFDALHLLGVLMHQRGRSSQALALIARALATGARSADAYSNHGRVLGALQRNDEALASFDNALALKPDHLEALFHRGNTLVGLGRLEEAVASYGQAIALKSDHSHALVNRGVALQKLGRPAEALASLERALAHNPAHVEALVNRGNVLMELRHPAEALVSYDQAVAARPDNAEALFNRGNALSELRRPADALASYDQALTLGLRHFEVLFNRGNMLMELRRPVEALVSYDKALALQSNHIELLSNRGNALRDLQRPIEALACYDRALALNPAQAEVLNNRGNALLDLNRPAEALTYFDQALALKSDYIEALINRGNALGDLLRPADALSSYEHALTLMPDQADAHWNRSLIWLAEGDFERGWREYEWRLRRMSAGRRDFPQPMWSGEDSIAGKTILLHAEQGFGDTIQFVRYVPLVTARRATVVLQVQGSLKALLSNLRGVSAIIDQDESLPPFDLHCPLLSLPLAFKTTLDTVPFDIPYVRPSAGRVKKWSVRIAGANSLRIGIAWSGSSTHKNDHNRSIALSRLAPLLAGSRIKWVSLQREVRDADLRTLESLPQVAALGREFDDFADTAAVISLLYLVISVDTAVAHLAGAMGKPAFILLPFKGEWRWLTGRDDSPWYPTARLFRQPSAGDWDSVIARVGEVLDSQS